MRQAIATLGTVVLLVGGISGPAAFAEDAPVAPPAAVDPAVEAEQTQGGDEPAHDASEVGGGASESDSPGAPLVPAVSDDETPPTVNVQIQTITPEEQGVSKIAQYRVEFTCVSTRVNCEDVVIDVPFTQKSSPATGATAISEWRADLFAEAGAPVLSQENWDSGQETRQIVFAAPLLPGESSSVRIDLTPRIGYVADGTSWEILPVIRASGAEPSAAPVAARSSVTAHGVMHQRSQVAEGGFNNELRPGVTFNMTLDTSVGAMNPNPNDSLFVDLTRGYTMSVKLPNGVEFVAFPEGSTHGTYDAGSRTASWSIADAQRGRERITLRVEDTASPGTQLRLVTSSTGSLIGETQAVTASDTSTIRVLSNDIIGTVFDFDVETNGETVGSGDRFIAPEGETGAPVTLTASLQAQHRETVSDLTLIMPCLTEEQFEPFTCETPGTTPASAQSLSADIPDGGPETVNVRLTLDTGTDVNIQVGADPVAISPQAGRVLRATATDLELPAVSASGTDTPRYALSLVLTVPDDAALETGDRLLSVADARIAAKDAAAEQIEASESRVNPFLVGALHAPILNDSVTTGWNLGETGVEIKAWSRWSAPLGERLDAKTHAILTPAGLTFNAVAAGAGAAEEIENFAGTGRTLVRFSGGADLRLGTLYVDSTSLEPGIYEYQVFSGFTGYENPSCESLAGDSLVPQELVTGVDGVFVDGEAADACHAVLPLVVSGNNTGHSIVQSVRGDLDAQWQAAPGTTGVSEDGSGSARYRITWANTGPTVLDDVVIYDVLPGPNDAVSVGQLAGLPRQSDFAVTYEDVVAPAGYRVAYSVSENPCRPELGAGVGECVDDWTETAPGDLSQVRALRFTAEAPTERGALAEFLVSVTLPVVDENQAAMNTAAAGAIAAGDQDVPSIETPFVSVGNVLRAPDFAATKQSSVPAGEAPRPGDDIEYTVTVRNDGTLPGEFGYDDVLTAVIDDATLTGEPVVTGAGNVTAQVVGDRLEIRGGLGGGESATVTYAVTIAADAADRGDDVLRNSVVPAGTDPGDSCEADDEMCTVHTVEDLSIEKAADPASGTEVGGGDTVAYAVTIHNRGHAAAQADAIDHLDGVLDDAEWVGDPVAAGGEVVAQLTDAKLRITGALPAGESATVTYRVRVLADTPIGDPARSLDNFLLRAGQELPEICAPGITTCTTHPIAEAEPDPEKPDPEKLH